MKKTPVWFTKVQKEQLAEFLEMYRNNFFRKFANKPDGIIDSIYRGENIMRKHT